MYGDTLSDHKTFDPKKIKYEPRTTRQQAIDNNGIIELTTMLKSIGTDRPTGELNAISISDGNGGRIEL
jgi:hypothetical protein